MPEDYHKAQTQIVEKAQTVFARFGFRKTTMEEIAQAAHKGKSTLYHYFQNKEEIFRAVVEKEANQLKREINQAITRENNPRAQLRAYILTRMHALKNLANLYQAFQEDYLESYSFIERLRVGYDEYERTVIARILQTGVERGEFVIDDLELMSYVIVIAFKGLEYPWAIAQDTTKIEENIDTLLHVFFYGLLKR